MRLTGAAEHAEYVILAESVSWRQAEQQSVQCFLNDSPCEKPTHKIIQRVRKMKSVNNGRRRMSRSTQTHHYAERKKKSHRLQLVLSTCECGAIKGNEAYMHLRLTGGKKLFYFKM